MFEFLNFRCYIWDTFYFQFYTIQTTHFPISLEFIMITIDILFQLVNTISVFRDIFTCFFFNDFRHFPVVSAVTPTNIVPHSFEIDLV